MVTIENIDGRQVRITWDFISVNERHDNNWCDWFVEGEDQFGIRYLGNCQADRNNPNDLYADVENIEKMYPHVKS